MIPTIRPHSRFLLTAGAVLLVACLSSGLFISRAVTAPAPSDWRYAGLHGETIHFLAAGHAHAGLLFAATGSGVERRADVNRPWRRVLESSTVWSVAVLPGDRTVLAGDEEGNVDLSHDGGIHWQRHAVSTQAVYAVAAQPERASVVLAGAAGGVVRSTDGGIHWHHVLALPRSAAAAIVWDRHTSGTVYAGAVAGDPHGLTQVYRSDDGGLQWHILGDGLKSNAGIMSLETGNRSTVYAGTMGNRIWQISNPATAWRQIASGIPGGQHVAGIASVPGRAPLLYAATLADGVFVSHDGGAHWEAIAAGLPTSDSSQIVLSLTYAPRDHVVYAGTVDGVYEHTQP